MTVWADFAGQGRLEAVWVGEGCTRRRTQAQTRVLGWRGFMQSSVSCFGRLRCAAPSESETKPLTHRNLLRYATEELMMCGFTGLCIAESNFNTWLSYLGCVRYFLLSRLCGQRAFEYGISLDKTRKYLAKVREFRAELSAEIIPKCLRIT